MDIESMSLSAAEHERTAGSTGLDAAHHCFITAAFKHCPEEWTWPPKPLMTALRRMREAASRKSSCDRGLAGGSAAPDGP
jgi:hypothetical protein